MGDCNDVATARRVQVLRPSPAGVDDGRMDRTDGCVRCGRAERLISGDGPTVCRVCVIAWTGFAAELSRGQVVAEPDRIELAHREHRDLTPGCIWCHSLRRARGTAPGWRATGGGGIV